MAYRIDFDHSLAHEIRRIAGHHLACAITLLEKQADGVHEAVHDARKHIKRVRALYRLIRSGAKTFAASETDRLGEIAGSLARLRNAAANVEAAHYLRSKAGSADEAGAIGRIAETLERERAQVDQDQAATQATIRIAISGLRAADKMRSELALPASNSKAAAYLSEGWKKVDAKARAALAACETTADDEPFHALRKRGQDRWMHSALLHALWPAAMNSIGNEAKVLVDLIGHEHDLAMLYDEITGHTDFRNTDADKQATILAIARERQRLQDASRKTGRHLFDHKPERDAQILELLIKNK